MSVITAVLVSVKRVVIRLIRLRLQSIEVQNDKCCDDFLALGKAHSEELKRIEAARVAAAAAVSEQAARRVKAAKQTTLQRNAGLSAKTEALEAQRQELLADL